MSNTSCTPPPFAFTLILTDCSHRTFYKDAMKYGFYELQSARDWYREVTADIGMHADLVRYWIGVAALLASPIAPHFAEHIWRGILQHPTTIQRALWPTPSRAVDTPTTEAGTYMRALVKNVRDAELTLLKKLGKATTTATKGGGGGQKTTKTPAFDPKKPRALRVYVATRFPEWQDACVQAVQAAWAPETARVDDAKVRALLMERGMIKDKRAMPFVQLFKVRSAAWPWPHFSLSALNELYYYRNGSPSLERRRHSSGSCRSWRRMCCARFCLI